MGRTEEVGQATVLELLIYGHHASVNALLIFNGDIHLYSSVALIFAEVLIFWNSILTI